MPAGNGLIYLFRDFLSEPSNRLFETLNGGMKRLFFSESFLRGKNIRYCSSTVT